MTKKMFMAVACLGVAIGFGTRPAAAQTMETVRVNLPYATKVGDVVLAPGAYSIRELKNSVIEISSEFAHGSNTFATVKPVMTANGEAANHTKVTLRQGSNGLQLDTIWVEGQDIGFELTTAGE